MLHSDTEMVEVQVDEVLAESDAALLFLIGEKEYWVPKAAIDMDESEATEEGASGIVYMAEWKAIDLELV